MAIAGIVAGGSGTRMGGELPKQFYELDSKPVLIYTIQRFLEHEQTDSVIIGINPSYREYAERLVKEYFPDKDNVFVTDGGSDRNATIGNIIRFAVSKLGCDDNEIILTHDAVRPFVSGRMISECIEAMKNCEICTAAVASTDTIAMSVDGKTIDSFPDRNEVYRVQTPQTFRIGTFMHLLSQLTEEERAAATDVCSLYAMQGISVRIIRGKEENIKLTYPYDYEIAKHIASVLKQ